MRVWKGYLLVCVLGLDDGRVDEGAEEGGLVPPDCVVIHVHCAQALHHLQLVVVCGCGGLCVGVWWV